MYFYKEINETGKVLLLLTYNQKPRITNPLVIEITQEEYDQLLLELTAQYADDFENESKEV
jgi:hypothetical protein